MPFQNSLIFEKKKMQIAREKRSGVILHMLSFYVAPSLFWPASTWPAHSGNPGAAAAAENTPAGISHLWEYPSREKSAGKTPAGKTPTGKRLDSLKSTSGIWLL